MAAKPSDELWAKARALYERGDSLREIEATTGIPYKTVDNRAKKNGWSKGSLAQLINDTVRVKAEFGTLEMAQQDAVSKAVDERVKQMEWLNKAALKNVSEAMKAECANQNDFRARADTIVKAKETVFGKGVETAIQINNQQPSTPFSVSPVEVRGIIEQLNGEI